jgi:hypothetical protein
MQMQLFGQNGHLEDTVNMLSVSFLEARKDIRHFSRQKNCATNLVLMNENLEGYGTSCLCHEPVSNIFVGAVTENCKEKYEYDKFVGRSGLPVFHLACTRLHRTVIPWSQTRHW